MKKLFTILLFFYACGLHAQTTGWTFCSNGEYGAQGGNAGRAMIFTGNVGLNGIGTGTSGLQYFISTPGVTMISSSSTLHGSAFVSSANLAYWAGNNTDGEGGLPGGANATVLTQVATDSRGLAFNNIVFTMGSYIQIGANDIAGQFWVKRGTVDSVFYAGVVQYGIGGNGSTGTTTCLTPTLMFFTASGTHIVQFFAGVSCGYVDNLGNVYTWGAAGTVPYLGRAVSGSNYATPMQVTYPTAITQIVGGAAPGVLALGSNGKLYGFSQYAGYMGNAGNPAYNSPVDLTDSISSYILSTPLGRTSFTMLGANSTGFHVICNDGSLHGWGDRAMGTIGDGYAANLLSPGGTSTPGFIDPSAILVLAQTHPVRVTNRNDYVFVSTGVNFCFITMAITADGQLHSCGRNKGGVIPNGVVECFGDGEDIGSFYPDFADVADLTPMNPTGISAAIPQTWLGCKTGSSTTNCHACGPTSGLTANAGGNQSISTTSTTLNGTGSTQTGGGYVVYYNWTISGPGSPVINQQSSGTPKLTGLQTGTYTVTLKVKDNGFDSTTQNILVVVNTGCNCLIKNKAIVYEKVPVVSPLFGLLLFGKEPDELQG
jgi:hypothetical protein